MTECGLGFSQRILDFLIMLFCIGGGVIRSVWEYDPSVFRLQGTPLILQLSSIFSYSGGGNKRETSGMCLGIYVVSNLVGSQKNQSLNTCSSMKIVCTKRNGREAQERVSNCTSKYGSFSE